MNGAEITNAMEYKQIMYTSASFMYTLYDNYTIIITQYTSYMLHKHQYCLTILLILCLSYTVEHSYNLFQINSNITNSIYICIIQQYNTVVNEITMGKYRQKIFLPSCCFY